MRIWGTLQRAETAVRLVGTPIGKIRVNLEN